MKKNKFLVVFFLSVFLLTACSDDDDDNQRCHQRPDLLTVDWKTLDSKLNGNDVITQNEVVFNENSTVDFYYADGTLKQGNWQCNNSGITITWNGADATSTSTQLFVIKELTETTLKWETELEGQGTLKETLVKK